MWLPRTSWPLRLWPNRSRWDHLSHQAQQRLPSPSSYDPILHKILKRCPCLIWSLLILYNYHPIHLTPCIGEVYNTIIKDRWLDSMRSNWYFDTSIQKALMPSVPGCIEHYAKLAPAINEAHTHHKSLCMLVGSGQCLRKCTLWPPHQILSHTPSKLVNMVTDFYSNLRKIDLHPQRKNIIYPAGDLPLPRIPTISRHL